MTNKGIIDNRYIARLSVYVLIINNGRLLMLKRHNTGCDDGNYTVPSGHVELNEHIALAAIREVKEEVNIDIELNSLKNICTMQRIDLKCSGYTYIDFFYLCRSYYRTPENNEIDKCSDVRWFKLNDLPLNIVGHVDTVIQYYLNDKRRSSNELLPIFV